MNDVTAVFSLSTCSSNDWAAAATFDQQPEIHGRDVQTSAHKPNGTRQCDEEHQRRARAKGNDQLESDRENSIPYPVLFI